MIFTSNISNIVDLYIRVKLRLRDGAFEMQLSFHVWGLSIRCSHLKLFLSNLSEKTKNILLSINIIKNFSGKTYGLSDMFHVSTSSWSTSNSALYCFRHTHNHTPEYLQRSSKTCNYHTPVFHMPKPVIIRNYLNIFCRWLWNHS